MVWWRVCSPVKLLYIVQLDNLCLIYYHMENDYLLAVKDVEFFLVCHAKFLTLVNSSFRMESIYRTWMRERDSGANLEELSDLQRELKTALGTAKWQVCFVLTFSC